jgi:rare lipoprotein A
MKPATGWRIAAVMVAASVLASCSSSGPSLNFKRTKEFFSEAKYGKASPRVVHHVGPVPKGGGHEVVGKPYEVAGQTFVPKQNPEGYSAVGLASWYGAAFHGRLTANGEVYDVNGITAAHPTLPLPSYVRVSNLENGRSMIVRVNDRGPFARGRLIDVSERVADMLGFHNDGTAKVRVDYMGPARMDGLDEKKLVASYRGPNVQDNGIRYAWNKPKPEPRVVPQQPRIVLASAAPVAPRLSPATARPVDLMPAFVDSADNYGGDDALGSFILRSGFVNSYAERPHRGGAARAAEEMAKQADLASALSAAAKRKADELGLRNTLTVVQLGAFGNDANADRVARDFARFGTVSKSVSQSSGLTVVSIALDPAVDPGTVIAAANAAGMPGAEVAAN